MQWKLNDGTQPKKSPLATFRAFRNFLRHSAPRGQQRWRVARGCPMACGTVCAMGAEGLGSRRSARLIALGVVQMIDVPHGRQDLKRGDHLPEVRRGGGAADGGGERKGCTALRARRRLGRIGGWGPGCNRADRPPSSSSSRERWSPRLARRGRAAP